MPPAHPRRMAAHHVAEAGRHTRVGREQERGRVDTVARGEMVEAELNRMIEKRSRKGETDLDEREDLWVESVRRYQERERRQIRAQWYGWHCDQVERHRRTLAALIAHHEGEAQRHLEPEEMDQAEGGS
jgi:hypothetical protein